MALTPEHRAISFVEFRLRVLEWHMGHDKGKKPEPPKEPSFAGEVVAGAQQQKAAAFLRREARTGR